MQDQSINIKFCFCLKSYVSETIQGIKKFDTFWLQE